MVTGVAMIVCELRVTNELRVITDPNPNRCHGLGRHCRRCKRTGKPVDGAYYCPTHAHQREMFEAGARAQAEFDSRKV